MEFKVGSDPELFLMKDNKFISAHGMIPGDKKNPHRVENGAVQVDGTALEFNIDPAMCEDSFIFNLESVMAQLKDMVGGYEVVATPVADFGMEYLSQQPEEALELGCDPDYNAWTSAENVKPDGNVGFRTGAGHIHLGWQEPSGITDGHVGICERIVRQMDFYLALPSIFFDDDTQRREMYGAAGAYRPKEYGLEYRVLSNKWLASKSLMAWAYQSTLSAVKSVRGGKYLPDIYGDIQHIINSSNKREAMSILEAEGLAVPNV